MEIFQENEVTNWTTQAAATCLRIPEPFTDIRPSSKCLIVNRDSRVASASRSLAED